MKTLFVNACIRKESRTRMLAEYLLKKLDQDYVELELQKETIHPLDEESLNKRSQLCVEGKFDDPSFRYARQFKEAETIVIAVPYYDLSFAARLKDYLETINVIGLTFHYLDDDVPSTLSSVKRLIYVTTAGGTIVSHEYGYGYVKAMFESFYEVKDHAYFYAEKLDLTGADPDAILKETRDKIDIYLKQQKKQKER
ncbi:MAG: NAD(P)H-dependent oxidoreductase [Erysipelotrichaceae bacterium]|nr:NAD(P)H-dependent oxidoreductase [Erysipelotrichaceae bacterium]